jgi:hypothetical protein
MLYNLIQSFCLTVHLRIEHSAQSSLNTKLIHQFRPESTSKKWSSISNNTIWIAIDIKDSFSYYIYKFFNINTLFTRDIGAQLSETVNNNQYRVINFFLKSAQRQVYNEVYR